MQHFRILLVLVVSFCASSSSAQILQLPTFRQFSIGTTVVIPDRGAAYLGGVNRSRYSSSTHGVPLFGSMPGIGRLTRNRFSSFETSGSHAFATATILDREAMDRAVLAAAEAGRTGIIVDRATRVKADFLSQHVGRRRPGRADYAGKSVSELNSAARFIAGPRVVTRRLER